MLPQPPATQENAMLEPPIIESFAGILVYDGDELIYDTDDPLTYIVYDTPEALEAALAAPLQDNPDC